MEKETESTKLVLSKFLLSIYREKKRKEEAGAARGVCECVVIFLKIIFI
jgi:hypothetical protein